MSSPRVPTYSPNRVNDGKAPGADAHHGEEGSQVAVRANYLPNIYQDGQDHGGSSDHGQGDNQQLVNFLGNANTGQLRTLARNVQTPLFPVDSPMAYIGPNARPAAYAAKSRTEQNRREWGDFLPGGTTRAKYLPLDGMEISFDANDRAINAAVPREVLAQQTTVPEDMDFQVRGGLYESHLNRGNPRKDRLQVYNLAGVSLRA